MDKSITIACIGKGLIPKWIREMSEVDSKKRGEEHFTHFEVAEYNPLRWDSGKAKTGDGEQISDCQGLGFREQFDRKGTT